MHPLRIERFDFFALRDFGQSFGAPAKASAALAEEKAPEPPPPPPPPTFSLEQLEAEKRRARDEGFRQGMEEGRAQADSANKEREQQLIALLARLTQQAEGVRDAHLAEVARKQPEITRLALEVARHVAGQVLRETPATLAEDLVRSCLPMLLSEPKITVLLHPEAAAFLREKLDTLAGEARYEGMLNLEPDVAMEPHDCRLSWPSGEASAELAEIWREIFARMGM